MKLMLSIVKTCYDNETEILTEQGWKYFYELNGSEKVITLSTKIREKKQLVPTEKQEFENDKEMYKIELEDGSELVASPEHKVYSALGENYKNSKSFGRSLMILPSNSSGECCFNNLDITLSCASKSFGLILNSQIPKCLEEINKSLRKSISRVISNLCSETANSKTLPFEIVFWDNLTSCPNLDKNENNPLCTFSSNKNFILNGHGNYEISFGNLSSKIQGCLDRFFSQGRICFDDFFVISSIFEHFQDYINHNSCTFESGLSMTDFAINDNMFVNFDSHTANEDKEIFKPFDTKSEFSLQQVTDVYKQVKEEKEVYFLNSENKPVEVKSIEKVPYKGKIYDVDVENDIVLVRRKNSTEIAKKFSLLSWLENLKLKYNDFKLKRMQNKLLRKYNKEAE